MPSSLPVGSYSLKCEPKGSLKGLGYKGNDIWDTTWVNTGLPTTIGIFFDVETQGSFSITYGQGWEI